MNKLLRTELFNLLIEKSKEEVNNNVMQNAYDEFIEKIRDISNENDYSTTYRILVATPQSPLYLTDETNLVEIMELVSGLFLSKRVINHAGKEAPLTEIGRAFEHLFNIKFGDIHKKHESVICRQANKRIEFLDILRKAITEENQKKGYL